MTAQVDIRKSLTTLEGATAYFNAAEDYSDEVRRYNQIVYANGGVRPSFLDQAPLRSQYRKAVVPGRVGSASGA